MTHTILFYFPKAIGPPIERMKALTKLSERAGEAWKNHQLTRWPTLQEA
jgi:hypothetical protein